MEEIHPEMDKLQAAVFRRLVEHLRLRQDVSNIELMGSAGFCRNCLADWLADASVETPQPITREEARNLIYGEPYSSFKMRQLEATPDQLARMERSEAENARVHNMRQSRKLDAELDQSFPASDPPSITEPR